MSAPDDPLRQVRNWLRDIDATEVSIYHDGATKEYTVEYALVLLRPIALASSVNSHTLTARVYTEVGGHMKFTHMLCLPRNEGEEIRWEPLP